MDRQVRFGLPTLASLGIGSDELPAVIHSLTDAVNPGGYMQLLEASWVLSSYTEGHSEKEDLGNVQD